MNNKEFTDHLMAVDDHIRGLYGIIMESLNQDDLDYTIEVGGEVYDFYLPLTREDKDDMDLQKSKVTLILLQDALFNVINSLRNGRIIPDDNEYRSIWGSIASMQRQSSKESTTDVMTSESYEVENTEKSKPLNYQSIYVKAQSKKLTDEEVCKLFYYGGNW